MSGLRTLEAAIPTETSLRDVVTVPQVAVPAVLSLSDRPLVTAEQAAELADLFKVLASDARLRLLHAVARSSEARAGDLAAAAGMSQQAASNQLQRLLDRRICATRREGTAVLYRIVDPCVMSLLNYGFCLVEPPCRIEGS